MVSLKTTIIIIYNIPKTSLPLFLILFLIWKITHGHSILTTYAELRSNYVISIFKVLRLSRLYYPVSRFKAKESQSVVLSYSRKKYVFIIGCHFNVCVPVSLRKVSSLFYNYVVLDFCKQISWFSHTLFIRRRVIGILLKNNSNIIVQFQKKNQ